MITYLKNLRIQHGFQPNAGVKCIGLVKCKNSNHSSKVLTRTSNYGKKYMTQVNHKIVNSLQKLKTFLQALKNC